MARPTELLAHLGFQTQQRTLVGKSRLELFMLNANLFGSCYDRLDRLKSLLNTLVCTLPFALAQSQGLVNALDLGINLRTPKETFFLSSLAKAEHSSDTTNPKSFVGRPRLRFFAGSFASPGESAGLPAAVFLESSHDQYHFSAWQ